LAQQATCARIVAKDLERTKTEKPEVFSTIQHYTFEWSPKHQSCVMVIEYRVRESGKSPKVQVLAANAVTMQPMEGTKNVFLIPASETKEIEDAAKLLFDRYAH
jgi:hypothetical protein